jgi:hypothetical protein
VAGGRANAERSERRRQAGERTLDERTPETIDTEERENGK